MNVRNTNKTQDKINNQQYQKCQQFFNKILEEDDQLILPPGVELLDTTVYGSLTICIDSLELFKNLSKQSDQTSIRIKFLGEKGSGKTFSARNSNKQLFNLFPNYRTYNVFCQMQFFYQYLQDMIKLRLIMISRNKIIGYSILDIKSYLKQLQYFQILNNQINFKIFELLLIHFKLNKYSLDFNDLSPFDNIQCVLPIISINEDNLKIGEIKVFVESKFDPNFKQFISNEPKNKIIQNQSVQLSNISGQQNIEKKDEKSIQILSLKQDLNSSNFVENYEQQHRQDNEDNNENQMMNCQIIQRYNDNLLNIEKPEENVTYKQKQISKHTLDDQRQNQQKQRMQKSYQKSIKKQSRFEAIHQFIVNIHKLTLINLGKDHDLDNIMLFYQFGSDERGQIGSFDYLYGQSNYEINYQGEKIYKLSNKEDLENTLIQEHTGINIDFEIQKFKSDKNQLNLFENLRTNQASLFDKKDNITASANLSSINLLDIIQSSKNQDQDPQQKYIYEQTINLKNNKSQLIVGKVQLTIIYQVQDQEEENNREIIRNKNDNLKKDKTLISEKFQECLVEKVSNITTLFPKSGYLNILISSICSLKEQKIEWRNYKIMASCDFFHESTYLSSIFKKINSSPCYNTTEEVLTIQQSIKINTCQELVNYFQDNTCIFQLKIFPLDDLQNRTNPYILGEIYINLQDILIKQVIKQENIKIKRGDLIDDQNENNNLKNNSPLSQSFSNESVGICSVHISYTQNTQILKQLNLIPQVIKSSNEIKDQKNSQNLISQKESLKNNYRNYVIIMFDEILNLQESDQVIWTEQMCYFRTQINGNSIMGNGSFKMNFIENKILKLKSDIYLQLFIDNDDLQFINPLNIELVARKLNVQQSEERVLGHISIDFDSLRKEFFENHQEKYTMKCIKSQTYTILKRNQNSSQKINFDHSIESSISKIRCNLRLLLVKFESKEEYEICYPFINKLLLFNYEDNLNVFKQSANILESLRISLHESSKDFDKILDALTFDNQTLQNLLKFSIDSNIQYISSEYNQKIVLTQRECRQLIEDTSIYDRYESGMINYEDFLKILRKYNPLLIELLMIESNKFDRQFTKINKENIGQNIFKFDYIQFFNQIGVLQVIQQENQIEKNQYQLRLQIKDAINVGQLNYGIAPNTFIKCVNFDFITSCVQRDQNPFFNYFYEIDLNPNKFKDYNQIIFVIYHREQNSNITISNYKQIEMGRATLDLSKLFFTNIKQQSKQESFKIKIKSSQEQSTNNNETYLHINVELNKKIFNVYNDDFKQINQNKYHLTIENKQLVIKKFDRKQNDIVQKNNSFFLNDERIDNSYQSKMFDYNKQIQNKNIISNIKNNDNEQSNSLFNNSSQNRIKKINKQIMSPVKNKKEIDRVLNIMQQDLQRAKQFFDYSSDSDDN